MQAFLPGNLGSLCFLWEVCSQETHNVTKQIGYPIIPTQRSAPPLFLGLGYEPPPHLEHNTLPSPIVLSHLLSGLLADVYRLIHLTCGVLILERLVFLAADWSGFPSLLFPLLPSLFWKCADLARDAGRRSPWLDRRSTDAA